MAQAAVTERWPSSSYAKILGEKLFRTWEIPRSGSKAEDGGKKRGERERLNDGENNGQATHGARKHAWRTQAAWAKKRTMVITMAKLRMAHAITHGARKPPGPINYLSEC